MSKKKLFHGTMNASKSAQILMQIFNFERQGKTFLIFKPAIDTRDEDFVKSRALVDKRLATQIGSDDNGKMYDIASKHKPDFIFVDEIQFFTKEQVEELSAISFKLKIPVFAYGLLISYTGELFEGSKRAIECGFTLHELKMQCDFCTEKSTHHLLYIDNKVVTTGEPIHVGDQEYKSACYECYITKQT
jgi:thymidine kinase